jgi:hypothetical protein
MARPVDEQQACHWSAKNSRTGYSRLLYRHSTSIRVAYHKARCAPVGRIVLPNAVAAGVSTRGLARRAIDREAVDDLTGYGQG